MGRSIPPFASLRAFEAAARHCSFKKAAEELNLSPSAISHQIKSLEIHLGICLFNRTHNSLELTEVARAYASDVAAALSILETASARVDQARDDAGLVINLFPSLVSAWLLPLLGAFKAQNRDVDVRIVTSLEPIPFTGSDIDVAIRYGEHGPADALSNFLFAEEIVPVCSPSFLAEYGPFGDPGAILDSTLIYCVNNAAEWSQWLHAAGLDEAVPARCMELREHGGPNGPHDDTDEYKPANRMDLDNRTQAIEAARNGLGVAMARTPNADSYLKSGDLVIPIEHKVATGMNYYLCWPERKARFRNVETFRDWLVSRLAHETASTEGEKLSSRT